VSITRDPLAFLAPSVDRKTGSGERPKKPTPASFEAGAFLPTTWVGYFDAADAAYRSPKGVSSFEKFMRESV
jgi:hypothetical protein